MYTHRSIYLSIYLSICLSIYLSIYLYVYLSISIYISVCIWGDGESPVLECLVAAYYEGIRALQLLNQRYW